MVDFATASAEVLIELETKLKGDKSAEAVARKLQEVGKEGVKLEKIISKTGATISKGNVKILKTIQAIRQMEKALAALDAGELIVSDDHRVVQAIAMLAKKQGITVKFSNPNCVSKSWPQFWRFLETFK